MTPAEVEAVLELWREVEGTQPTGMILHRDHNNHADFVFTLFDEPGCVELSDAEASDLICGHLRRWLEWRCDVVEQVTGPLVPCTVFIVPPGRPRTNESGETLLLALIAAVRAVAGTTGQPQTQGGQDGGSVNHSPSTADAADGGAGAEENGAPSSPVRQAGHPNTPTAADAAGETK